MKKLRKLISAALVLAMLLTSASIGALAYSDVDESSSVSEAVGILSNLKIFTGFEDGTFRLNDTVTRAQMAAIVCRMLGYESQAESSSGSTVFTDVPANHWASGYINVAQQMGIINGYGGGLFGPEDKVTYEQAVKMVVCALGYELVAQGKGGYPTGYLSVASSEGITKNSKGSVGEPAKRSTLVMLVYNSLEVRLFDQSSWTTNGSDEYKKTDDTVLSKYLGVQRWEGVVTDVPYTSYADKDYRAKDTPYITIDGFYKKYSNGSEVKVDDDSPKRADCSLVDAGQYFGKKVIAYIGDSEDDDTGHYMVYAISEKTNGNTVTKLSSTQLVDSSDKEWNTKGQISYRKVGSSKVYDLDLDSKVKFYVNYSRESRLDEKSSTSNLESYIENGGSITAVSNDNDDDIEYVIVEAFDEEGVIETVNKDGSYYSYDLYTGTLDDIDTDDDDELTIVYRDGSLSSVSKLDDGDTVSTVKIGKNVRLLYASSKTVTGSVSAYDKEENTVYIGGTDYDISPMFGKTASSLKDEEGTFFLNVNGQIAYNESDSVSSGNYGFVLAVDYSGGISDGYVAQVALADGTIAEYFLNSKVKMYDDEGNTLASNDAKVAEKLAAMADGNTSVKARTSYTTVGNAKDMVFKFTVKNGRISKIKELPGGSYTGYLKSNTKKYDAESMSYGSVEFDKDTVVFSVDCAYSDSSTTRIKDDDVSIGKVSKFFGDGEDGYTFVALDEDGGTYGAVIGFELSSSVPEDSDAVIIKSIKSVTYNDDDAVRITGIRGGKEVSFIIYDENNNFAWNDNPETLEKGDVILVSAAGSDDVVSDFKLLYKASKSGIGTVTKNAKAGDTKDDIFNAAGKLNKSKTTSSKFYLDTDVKNSGSVFAEKNDGISMRSSANYTLVDYSESLKNPEVTRKSAGTSLFSTSSRYNSFVFVRVYDGVLAEAVVYRFSTDTDVVKTVSAPVITINGDKASITCSTADADIYYTTDGSAPTESSNLYKEAITLTPGTTVKAFAVRAGYEDSSVVSQTYTVTLTAPSIAIDNSGNVTITSAEGADIYYTTDGADPTASSTKYAAAFTVTSGATVKAIAVKAGYENSSVASQTYKATLTAPSIAIDNSGNVTITSAEGADIHYTTDGADPTAASVKYNEAFTVTSGTTVKAIAVKDGYENSGVASQAYMAVLVAPSIKIKDSELTITAAEGAVIRYTLDGEVPTSASAIYETPVTLTKAVTVKAIAEKGGYTSSSVATDSYKPVLDKPEIKVSGNKVTITAADGAAVYYTLDGGTPSDKAAKYESEITLAKSATVKAIAVKDGFENSDVAAKEVKLVLDKPVIKVSGNKVTITAADGAAVYYTLDGGTPSDKAAKYESDITLAKSATVKAIAVKDGFENSDVAAKEVKLALDKPVIKVSGNKVTITAADGTAVYYTLDGGTPSDKAAKYEKEITLDKSTTVKAIAVKNGFENSDVSVREVVLAAATPVISIKDGTAAITTATVGADIYYTTDGSVPTAKSLKYSKPFMTDGIKVLKAIAVKNGYENSAAASADVPVTAVTQSIKKR